MTPRLLCQVRVSYTRCSSYVSRHTNYSSLAALKSAPTPTRDCHDANSVAGPSTAAVVAGPHSLTRTEEAQVINSREDRAPKNKARRSSSTGSSSTSSPSAIKSGKAEAYLASLHAAGLEPTASDLERCRPAQKPYSNSPQYPVHYNALVDTLCRSFSKEQLRRFLQDWDPNAPWCRSHRTKTQYAEYIIEKMWAWPSLKEVERAKRDRTEVSVESFPLSASQLFLLLGKDGSELLEMSRRYNVHISLTAKPLALRVEGLRGSLRSLTEHINSVKSSITEELCQLPLRTSIPADMVQRISRLAGAYLENIGSSGKIRICAKSLRDIEFAKRLASRATHELNRPTQPTRLTYAPCSQANSMVHTALFPTEYSIYPFLLPGSLPWTMNTGGTFRVRRVGDFLMNRGEDVSVTGGLAGRRGKILASEERQVGLQDLLLSGLEHEPASESSRRSIKASMGHVLLTTRSQEQRATLVPPLTGRHPLPHFLKWMDISDIQSTFVPSLPSILISSSPTNQKIIHRLIYHAISPSDRQTTPGASGCLLEIAKVMYCEVVLSHQPVRTRGSEGSPDFGSVLSDHVDSSDSSSSFSAEMACWNGREVRVNLMMPDRPMDMQLSAFESNTIQHGHEPAELRSYTSAVHEFLVARSEKEAQPDAPLMFSYGGDTYILHSSSTVRQSIEHVDVTDKMPQSDGTRSPSVITVVNESVLDLESDHKSTHCEITCDDHTSEESWRRFLRQCDILTSRTNQLTAPLILDQPANDDSDAP